MACRSTFKFLRRWAKRIIFSYILFVLLFTCPLITDESEKEVDFYICKTGDGIHDLMLDSPLYPLWTKVIDPSVEVIRQKAYPILKKASKRFEKKIKPLIEKASAEGQVYLKAAQEKFSELHELHLAPTVKKIQVETDKIYKQYKPTIDKHASNIHTVYTENVKPHLVKHSSTLFDLIKSNTPKPVYEKIEYMDYFIKNELNLSTSTIPAKVHGFFKYRFLPVLYLKVNNVVSEIKNFYEPHEKNFHSSPAGSFYKEKTAAFDTMRKDPKSLFHKITTKLCHFYDTTSTLLYEKIDEFLTDPADLETEENVASAYFHKSQENPKKTKAGEEPVIKTDSIKKTVESVASAASETIASAKDRVKPKETVESVASVASKNIASVKNSVKPKETVESVVSAASETIASVTSSVLPKKNPDMKKAASKAADALSEGVESVASKLKPESKGDKNIATDSKAKKEKVVTKPDLAQEKPKVAAKKASKKETKAENAKEANSKPKVVEQSDKAKAKGIKAAATESKDKKSAESKDKKPVEPKAKKSVKTPASEETVQKDSKKDEL